MSAAPLTTRPVVRLLDSHTVNQIAAGEVVERPASALKELLENALDAHTAVIEIDLEEAGRRLLRVADDGHGMDVETALSALQRHATSKISRADDLLSVASYGFRGEALPSIASVSTLTLETGYADGLRHQIVVEHGDIGDPRPVSGPTGTTVTVENLFSNTPARLKFLKTDATELSACIEVVSKAALARPDVTFRLRHHGQTLLQTSGSDDLATAVAEVWGRDNARALVPVDHYNGAARVRGLVSPPHFTKPTRAMQWFFVNGRPVKNRTLTAALDQALRSLTPERRFAVAALMLEIDPAGLDVNVSPTKSEVKFHQERAVFDAVRRGVKEALLAHGMVPTVEEVAAANTALREISQATLGPLSSPVAPPLGWDQYVHAQSPLAPSAQTTEEPTSPTPAQGHRFADFIDGLRILAQVEDTFIIAENRTALLIIDQHVAHERILYEMLRDTRGSVSIESQPLLTPETLHLDKRAAAALAGQLNELRQIGFDLEPFGDASFLVRAVPALSRRRQPLDFLRDFVDELTEGTPSGPLTPTRDEVYIMASCKMAIKAGDKLGFAEMQKLVEDLAQTENPFLCPHGRPITITLPKSDLWRKFKR